jgi:uncharacterized repeat protein (TIGR01451 family)
LTSRWPFLSWETGSYQNDNTIGFFALLLGSSHASSVETEAIVTNQMHQMKSANPQEKVSMNTLIKKPKLDCAVPLSGDLSRRSGKVSMAIKYGVPFNLFVLLVGLACLLFGTPVSQAHESPPGCTGSGLGINLFTDVGNVHVGDTLRYSVTVFNGLPGSPRTVCDATGILAGVVTPDGLTNMIGLRRTTLLNGQSDFYTNVVSYVVRAQDINADGTVRASAFDNGDIHQNDTDSRANTSQGVNTEVNQPCIQITVQCTGSVGQNGAIQFTGSVLNCGNNTLVGVTVTNFVNNGQFTVLFPTNLLRGQIANFSGSWIPSNPCLPSTATLVARGVDEFTATPQIVTSSASTTCANVLTPGILVTKACPVGPVGPGQLLVYSGSVSNTGNVTLTNIVVVSDQPAPNTIVFTLGSLAPGTLANFTGSYTLPAICSTTSTLTSTAASVCGAGVTNSASSTCPILTAPRIAVTTTCATNPVAPGGVITYSGFVQNSGNITLTNILVVSDRPAPNTTVFTVATLAPGALANFTGSYTLLLDNACATTVTILASGRDNCTSALVTNTAAVTCGITTAPSIAVTLACPATPVGIGGVITYTGTVRNSGNITLNNVVVVSDQPGTNRIVLNVVSLAPGASNNFVFSFTAPSDACSVSSTVTASGFNACTAANVVNSATVTCPVGTASRITVAQNCPTNPVGPGGVLTYSGFVQNAGNTTLSNVVVTSDRSGTVPVFTVATLAPGAVANFTGSYTVPTNIGCSITSTLTAAGSDKCVGNQVTASVTTTCPVLTTPAIKVTQLCPPTTTAQGGTLTFTGFVQNTGNITLSNVVVFNDRTGTLPVFTVATLAPGGVANFTGSFTVPSNCCSVSSMVTASGKDICTGATVTDTSTTVCPVLTTPSIVVTKVCPTKSLEPGEVLRYTGSVSNAGNITLVNVIVTNSLSPSAVLGPITLSPGESVNYTASYIVPPDFCGTDTVTARALDECTKIAVSNSVTTTCPIISSPRIAVTQSCPLSPTPRGGVYTFTGTVSNPGNVTLTNVFVVNNQPVPNTAVIGPITLAPGASVNFTGNYVAPTACCEILSMITARGQDRCAGTTVTATASTVCPLLSTPLIAVTRVCPVAVVPVGGVFVFKGTVSNIGDAYLTNVFVFSSQPATVLAWNPGTSGSGVSLASISLQNNGSGAGATHIDAFLCQGANLGLSSSSQAGNNTVMLGPIQLTPGESKTFSGSYVVTAGSNPLADTVTATGMDICQARTVTATATCAGVPAPAAANPDIFFQSTDGFLSAWFMNGITRVSATFLNPSNVGDVRWSAVGSSDFNGDGNTDLLFQHTDGTLSVWYMQGTNLIPSAKLLNPTKPSDLSLRVAATGDFNRDGRPDLLFQHTNGTLSVWFMNGTNQLSSSTITINPGVDWKAVGTGDLNGDGNLDIIFQKFDGAVAVWFMNGLIPTVSVPLNPASSGNVQWRIVGTTDLNRDGKTDLLFQHSGDGSVAVWYMNGINLTQALLLNPSNPGGTWKIVAPK